MDKHYWKDAYKEFWEVSSKKEVFVKNLIEKETEFKVHEIGLGAGSYAFITGSAKDNNVEKGDADLYVEKVDAFVEVTGPNIPMPLEATLWFRPDKLNNTYKKLTGGKGRLHLLIHIQDVKGTSEKLIRGINLDKDFFERAKAGEFNTVYPRIRGREEKYTEIKASDKSILNFDEIIDLLKKSI